jgi:hypothetical protein
MWRVSSDLPVGREIGSRGNFGLKLELHIRENSLYRLLSAAPLPSSSSAK